MAEKPSTNILGNYTKLVQQARAQNPASPVFVADLWTSSDWTMAETLDCVHPNDVGAQRMGMNWYQALRNILKPD